MSEISKPAYKQEFIRVNMASINEKKRVKRQVGTRKIKKIQGFFQRKKLEVEEPIYEIHDEWVSTGKKSDKYIDIKDFSIKIVDACNKLHADGYDVISIISTIDGRYNHHSDSGKMGETGGFGLGYGYGYSVTDGAVIIAKLRN